jgi:hypothetical protein
MWLVYYPLVYQKLIARAESPLARGVHIRSTTHPTTGATGPSLRWGDAGVPHLHLPRINPNSLTDRARLVC